MRYRRVFIITRMLKLKHVIIVEIDNTYHSSCFEENFRPIKNVESGLKLLEYSKPLGKATTDEEHFLLCEALFNCTSGKCSIEHLNLVSIDHNEYFAWFVLFPQKNMYIILQLNEITNTISAYSVKQWLEVHYPIHQFIKDVSGYSREQLIDIVTDIDILNKQASKFKVFDKEFLSDCIQMIGLSL